MILFSDLPDHMSAQIDEFIQYNWWKIRFSQDVISWIKKPKYGVEISIKSLKLNKYKDNDIKSKNTFF